MFDRKFSSTEQPFLCKYGEPGGKKKQLGNGYVRNLEFLVLVPIPLNNSTDGQIELLRKLKTLKRMTLSSINDSNVSIMT